MRKFILLLSLFCGVLLFAQGASISWAKKIKEPIVISTGDTIKVGQIIYYQLGANPDGSFRFVQDLNNFNEPIKQSSSRTSMIKQPIVFFKIKDGVVYAFTKYFVTNLEAAILAKEIEIIR